MIQGTTESPGNSWCDEKLQDIHVAHHRQEDKEREEYIVRHRRGVSPTSSILTLLLLGEDERVISVAESLREEDHYDSQLVASSVDTQLRISVVGVLK